MKVFIDTNVLLDFICARAPFDLHAAKIFQLASDGNIEAIICSLSYINACYIGKKYGFKNDEMQSTLQAISEFCRISAIDESTIRAALLRCSKDFEDEVQLQSAIKAKADVIVTRNVKDFEDSVIQVLTPEQFLNDNKH